VLVDLLHDLGVNAPNPFLNLGMEFLDLFCSILCLPTNLVVVGSEVRSKGVCGLNHRPLGKGSAVWSCLVLD